MLLDQIAIVTGASSGIGRATALALAGQGANLALASRNVDELTCLADEIQALGRDALVVKTDDILVSSAGQYFRKPIAQVTKADLQQSLAVNLFGGFYAVQAVLPHMLSRHRGHLLLVSSLDGKFATPQEGAYVTAKFALNGFSATLRQELVGSGIAVTLVLPGRVDTPMIQNLKVPWISGKLSPEAVAEKIVHTILGRRQAEVILPFQAGLLYYISVISPSLADKLTRLFHTQGWIE